MQITGFNPLIVTTDPENTIKLFEELGFERRHTKDDLEDREDIVGVRMKDANGFHVDIVHTDRAKQDMVTIRMNVDNFDEAREMLEKRGFKSNTGQTVEDSSSKSIGMYAPSGFQISLVQHIKKED
jgi:adenylate cyclase class IV